MPDVVATRCTRRPGPRASRRRPEVSVVSPTLRSVTDTHGAGHGLGTATAEPATPGPTAITHGPILDGEVAGASTDAGTARSETQATTDSTTGRPRRRPALSPSRAG